MNRPCFLNWAKFKKCEKIKRLLHFNFFNFMGNVYLEINLLFIVDVNWFDVLVS